MILTGHEEAHILGKRANVRVVVELYNWVEPQIIRLADKSPYKRGDKLSYISGIIDTIRQKLTDSRRQFEADNPNSRALVVNIQGESDRYYRECYPHVRSSTSAISNGSAFQDGQSAGHKVSVTGASAQIKGRLLLA